MMSLGKKTGFDSILEFGSIFNDFSISREMKLLSDGTLQKINSIIIVDG